MADVIQSYGLFWREADVYWGAGSQKGELLGVPAKKRSSDPVDFREQIGIYVLYEAHQMVYFGQTGSGKQRLFKRLRRHRKDVLAGRWDIFSWFGMRRVLKKGKLSNVSQRAGSRLEKALDLTEAILIAAAEPQLNRQGGRFGKSAMKYLQVRDERLGRTQQQMIQEMWESFDAEE